jgi:LacI family transcriptional regulator
VSDDTRRRVDAAAAHLGYRPNTLARSMITGTTQTIGVVIADIDLSFFARAVRGIADTAKAAGFEVILANSDENPAKERAAVGVLLEKRVDGLIVSPAQSSDATHLQDLVRRGVPLVLLDRGSGDVASDVVVVDNRRAAQNATAHLLRLGHRRIAIVIEQESALDAGALGSADPGPAGAMTSRLRQLGWAAALRAGGIAVVDGLIWRTSYDREAARDTTAAGLAGPDRPTAILTTDETMSLGALDAIMDAGLRIPEDMSVVAFDDAEWTTVLRPPLTVVAQPVYELGAAAARRLVARIAGDERPPEIEVLDTTFILRGSTAPPPGSGTATPRSR